MNIREKIGQRISELRNQKGMTQGDLAASSGVGRSHLSFIENGKYDIRIDILDKIAQSLDCDIEIQPKDGRE